MSEQILVRTQAFQIVTRQHGQKRLLANIRRYVARRNKNHDALPKKAVANKKGHGGKAIAI